jgi:hypothetical protein
MLTRVKRLPKVGFKPEARAFLTRATATGRGTEEVEVEIISVRHEPRWSLGMDGRHEAEPAIYQVRVISTGEVFPADERGLNRHPKPKKKGRA